MIVVMLRKTSSESWGFLTEKEASLKKKDDFKPDLGADADPQQGLMNLMKKMYDDGDDEMKRTISKAFVEGREKQQSAEPMI
jgi:calcyclin binding protein